MDSVVAIARIDELGVISYDEVVPIIPPDPDIRSASRIDRIVARPATQGPRGINRIIGVKGIDRRLEQPQRIVPIELWAKVGDGMKG